MFCTFLDYFLIEKSFLPIQSTSWITVVFIIIPRYQKCYKPHFFMDSLFSILFYLILSFVFPDCVIVYELNLSLLMHKGSRRHVDKWIKTSPSQYSLNKYSYYLLLHSMKMFSESGSREDQGYDQWNQRKQRSCWKPIRIKDSWGNMQHRSERLAKRKENKNCTS